MNSKQVNRAMRIAKLLFAAASAMLTSQSFAAVGRTPGIFDVSSTGAATYTIPLWTPPGPNGMQPELALTYNSQLSNGVLGVGWSLEGLSSIERCLDKSVSLTLSDLFCLNGQVMRVLPNTGAYGSPNSVYRTEIESFATITAYGVAGNGPQSFVLQNNEGTYEYGATTDSRVTLGPTGTAFRWKLNKATDRAGNTYVVSYENRDGHAFPTTIQWAPTSAGATTYLYTATFNYSAERTAKDSQSGYVGGRRVSSDRRLENIKISHVGTVVRRYVLTYDVAPVTQRSRLTFVKECADDAASNCLAPTAITYQPGALGVSTNGGSAVNTATSLQKQAYDFNGDNRDDLLYVSNGSWQVSFANTGGFSAAINTGIPGTAAVLPERFLPGASDGILANISGVWWYWRWNGASFTSSNLGIPFALGSIVLDVDGNGLSDLVVVTKLDAQAQFTAYNNVSGVGASVPSFAPAQTSAITIPNATNFGIRDSYKISRHQDFDGDGRDDLLLYSWRIEGAHHTDERVRYDFTTPVYSRSNGFELGVALEVGEQQSKPWVIHFNDDRCSDQLVRYISGIVLSSCLNEVATQVSIPYLAIDALDWDSDGRDDILVDNGGTIGVLRSTGAGLSPLEATSIPVIAGDYFAMDIDGDGLNDIVHQSASSPYAISYFTKTGAGTFAQGVSKPDLATSFSDGFGVSHTLAYTYTTPSLGSYTAGTETTSPLGDTTRRMVVVNSVTHTDGASGAFNKTYSYVGARDDLGRDQFAGFESMTETDTRTGLRSRQTFRQDFPFTGMVKQSAKLKPNDVALSLVDIEFAQHTYASDSYPGYLPYAGTTTITRRDPASDALISTTTITDTIDAASGGLTDRVAQIVESGSANGAQPYTHTSRIHNTLFTVAGCVGRPQTSTQTNSNTIPNQGTIVRTTRTEWSGTYCRPTQITVEPGDAKWQVTTDLLYDDFGNVNHITETPAAGSDQAPRVTQIGWGTTGQFPRVITNPKGQQTLIDWNAAYGVRTNVTLPNGAVSSWTPDALGRIQDETRPDSTRTVVTMSACSAANGYCLGPVDLRYRLDVDVFDSTNHTNPARTDSYYFDGFDRVRYADITGLSGVSRTITAYDQLGRIATETVPHAPGAAVTGVTSYSYDLLNRVGAISRPTSESDPTPAATTIAYSGLTRVVTDPEGKPKTYIEDALGQIVRTIDALGSRTDYEYDAFGNLLRTIAAANDTSQPSLRNEINLTYSKRGHKLTSDDPDMGFWEYDYFPFGELRWQRDAKGQETRFNYDELSRLTERREGTGATERLTTFGYDNIQNDANGIGQLTSASSAVSSETYRYDEIGRLRNKRITIGAASFDYDYTYGAHGGLDTLTYPQTTGTRLAVRYSYVNGYLKQVEQPGSTVFWRADIANARGQITQATLGNGVVRTNVFDAVTGLLSQLRAGIGGGSALQNESYLFDRVGNLEQRQISDSNRSLTEDFVYDDLHRLDFSRLNGTVNLDMSYDALGNITGRSDISGGANWTYHATKKHAVVSAGSHSYSYDANGNAITRDGYEIKWTISNLPYEINGLGKNLTFSYGPTQQRVQQVYHNGSLTETTSYIGGLLEKVDADGETDWRHSILAGGETVAIVSRKNTGANATWYMLRDHLGSVAKILDGTGGDFVSESFAAFGARRDPGTWSGPCPCPDLDKIRSVSRRGYTDHEMIGGQSMGLIHMNGRVQDSITGRFLSPDPFVQSPFNLQSLNRYSYVFNNPLSYIDPSGYKRSSRADGDGSDGVDLGDWADWGGRYDVDWGDLNPTGGMGGPSNVKVPKATPLRDATVGGTDYDGTGWDFAGGLLGGAGNDGIHFAIFASGYSGKFGVFLLEITTGATINSSTRFIEAPQNNLGEFGYDLGPALTTLIGGGESTLARGGARLERMVGRLCCFVAGTLVLTEEGLRPIEEIEVGDLVLSRDENTGETAYKPVTELIRRHDREIWELKLQMIDGSGVETFETTDDHPWRTMDGRWAATAELQPGVLIQRANGAPAMVVSVVNTKRTAPTFNFEVADFHSYFVGQSGVWVHNANCSLDLAAVIKAAMKNGNPGPSGRLSAWKWMETKWDRATFGTVAKSILYHFRKHGNGLDVVEYTRIASEAFNHPAARKIPWRDKLHRDAVRVISPTGKGLFTPEGKVIWFEAD